MINKASKPYRIWKLISIASIFSFSFFCSILFTLFILGYALVVSEPDIIIASIELALGVNGMAYVIYSAKIKWSLPKYPWLFTAIAQYFDVLTTWLAYTYGAKSYGELNFLIGSPFGLPNLFYKLIVLPLILLYIQFNLPDSKAKRVVGTIPFLVYVGVCINNLIPLVI